MSNLLRFEMALRYRPSTSAAMEAFCDSDNLVVVLFEQEQKHSTMTINEMERFFMTVNFWIYKYWYRQPIGERQCRINIISYEINS
jgi:hypothetical protein